MSVALVSGQSGQTARQPKPASNAGSPAAGRGRRRRPRRPRRRAAPDVAAQRALVDQYCVTCHNAQAEDGQPAAGPAGPRAPRRPRGNRGKGRPEAAGRHDAADGHAAAGSGDARVADHAGWRTSSIAARSRICLPPGLHRLNRTEYANAIRDLLGARSRCHEVPAVRRFDARLRQHRRRADDVAGADGGVSVGGRQDQPPGDRRRVGADAGRVRRARRHRAELPRRGAAVRHARRHADQASSSRPTASTRSRSRASPATSRRCSAASRASSSR